MPEITESRYVVHASWNDAPHLDEKTKRELLAGTPPHLRKARSEGIPSLGAGAIYPIEEEEIICEPFAIPADWKRGYGFDVGAKTAAVWLAQDPGSGVLYAYAEYYSSNSLPPVHATAIKAGGEWIKGAIDPASRNRSQTDGERLMRLYGTHGLNIVPAVNAVEAGISTVWEGLTIGKIKLFRTLSNTLKEYRLYRRVEKKHKETGVTTSQIVKKDDHLMDALRYGIMTWQQIGAVKPKEVWAVDQTAAPDPISGM